MLKHEDVLNLKRAPEVAVPPPTRRAVIAALRQIASGNRSEFAEALTKGRTVYQDAGNRRVERIEHDGTRTVGRFVNRRFIADEPQRTTRRR